MPRPNDITLINSLEIRSTAAQNSGSAPFGALGFSNGIVSVENGLDQNVTAQVQGKAFNAATWQNVGDSVTVTTSGVNKIVVGEPWPLLRVQITAAGTPTTGDLDAYLSRVPSGVGATNVSSVPAAIQGPGNPSVDSYTSVAVNLAASTNNQVLAAAPGASKQIWVYGLFMMADTAAGTVTLQDEDDTALSGTMAVSDEGGWVLPISGNFAMPWIKVATNKALEADTGACTIDGILTYAVVDVS